MKIQKKEQRGRKRKGFMNFEWSKEKADLNLMKHNVTFEEASSVFDDPLSKIFDDASNSYIEIREKIIGFSKKGRLLFVSFTETLASYPFGVSQVNLLYGGLSSSHKHLCGTNVDYGTGWIEASRYSCIATTSFP